MSYGYGQILELGQKNSNKRFLKPKRKKSYNCQMEININKIQMRSIKILKK